MTEEFLSLLGPEWRKEFADLKAEVADISKMIVEFNKTAKASELKLVNAKSIGEAIKLADELKQAQKQLQDSVEKGMAKGAGARNREAEAMRKAAAALEKQRLEELRLQKQREQAFDRYEKQLAREQAAKDKAAQRAQADALAESRAIAKLGNDYELLKQAYNDAAAKAKNFGVSLGLNSEQFKQASAEARKMHEILLAVETSVGDNRRNVGNYGSGRNQQLDLAVSRILQEAPSAVNSINTFFLAISNNLPDLFTEIGKVNQGLVELKATAAEANLQLQVQTGIQKAAAGTSKEAEEALSAQVESVIASIGVSREQAMTIKAGIQAEIEAGVAKGESTAVIASNTEQLVLNAGASVEDTAALRIQTEATLLATAAAGRETAALQAQTVATVEATAALNAQPGVLKSLAKSLLSYNTLLTAGVLLLTMFGGKIIDWIATLFKGENALSKFAERQRFLSKALSDGSSEVSHAIEVVEHLRSVIDLAKKGFIDKDRVVKDFNRTIGQTVGEVKNLDEAEQSLNRNAEAYIQMMLYKSAATAALKEASENYVKSLKEQFIADQENEQVDAAAAQANPKAVVIGSSPVGVAKSFNSAAAKERAKPFDEAAVQYTELYRKLNETVNTIAKKYKFDIYGGAMNEKAKKQPKPTDLTNETLSAAQKVAEAQAKLRGQQVQQDMEANRMIYEDESQSYDDRRLAVENFNSDRLYQLKFAKEGELKEVELALKKIDDVEKKAVKSRTKEETALLMQKDVYLTQQQEITERYTAEEEKATREGQDRISKLFELEYSKRKAALAANLAEASERISEQVATELEILAQRYAKSQLTESAYRAAAAQLRNNYHVLELQDQLALVDAEIANRRQFLKDATDLEKQAADIRKNINEEAAKANIAAMEMEADARRSLYQEIGQLARSVGDAVVKAIDGGYQRQMDQLEARKKGIQDALEVELAAIEATTFAGVAREEKIAIAKANAADKEKQIDAEREAIENRRKELNRLVQAAAITGQAIQTGVTLSAKAAEATAQAALLAANPLTAAYAPIALGAAATIGAQIPIVAGIAAAQIAALYAYKHGTDDHPVDGLAMVGDGFRKEVVVEPDGKTYLTPARPTIAFLPQHSKVFPSVEDYMQRHHLNSMTGVTLIPLPSPTIDVSGIRADLTQQTATLEKAIRSYRPVIFKGRSARFDTYYQRARA